MRDEERYDICVIGGGINGTGIARDAAGRGHKVILFEARDLAQGTSSASTKLIHGGLRYLEQYAFRLVAESLNERERLLRAAPHIIWPMTFILPHMNTRRPAWMIRLGLFLYDRLGKRELLPGSRFIRFQDAPLKSTLKTGFSYSDCWVEDSRLVILNARDAADRGAVIKTRKSVTAIRPGEKGWQVTAGEQTITAKSVVNAAGPWVRKLLDDTKLSGPDTPQIRLVRGSHIIIPRLYAREEAYILQHDDGRVIFVIPYEGRFTLIGTTDIEHGPLKADPKISDEEIAYLCEVTNQYFRQTISPDDVVSHYSGVRPLLDSGQDDPSSVTRDYKLIVERHNGYPLLNVFGGKLTTYRKLAEQAMRQLSVYLPAQGPAWTATAPLPGGDIPDADFGGFLERAEKDFPDLEPQILKRLCRAYGTKIYAIFKDGFGADLGDGVSEAEISYLIEQEWACSLDDILWRRSKLGLHISDQTKDNILKAFPSLQE